MIPAMRKPRRLTKAGRLAALALALFAAGACDSGKKAPPIILVAVDTLRADALGIYGAARSATPRLDAWSKEAVVCRQAYAQAPWTLPSFASLFTSTFPGEHGAGGRRNPDRFYPIHEGLATATEALRAQGYRTAAVVNNIFLKGDFGFERGFDSYDFFPASVTRTRTAREVTELGIRKVKELEQEGGPFFLFLHYFDPHFTYRPPPEFQQRFGGDFSDTVRRILMPDEIRSGKVKLHPWDKDNLKNLYLGEVAFADSEIGRFFDFLEKEGVGERALVVVTSDHGEEFWDHGDFEHGHTQYEELVKVPLLIRFPGKEHGGSSLEDPVRLMDLMPAIFDYAGLRGPATFQGSSFLPRIEGGGAARGARPPGPLLFESCLYGEEKRALRIGDFKLVKNEVSGAVELYDLATDPGEQNNVRDADPEKARSLEGDLDALCEALRARAQGGKAVELPDDLKKTLQELGYAR